MKKIITLLICGFLFSCTATKPIVSTTSDGKITFKIVQLNDVYEIAPLNNGQYGGMARVAYLRDSIQKENPNTFLVMAGDFLNPSLLSSLKHQGKGIQGKQMIEVMNAMNFDLVTFGNHEFDFSETVLQNRLNESEFEWTSANTRHVNNGEVDFFYVENNGRRNQVTDYSILTIEDADGDRMNLGIFGVTIASNPKDYVYYGDVYEESERVYNEMKNQTDIIIGLTHIALDQDKNVARRLPDLPLIMGGHEHHNMLVKEGNTMIAKADANAKTMYVHTFTYDKNSENFTLDSELVWITDKVSSNAEIDAIVEKWDRIMEENLRKVISNPDEIIYHAAVPWDGTDSSSRGKQTNLGEIITKSMKFAYDDDAEAALVNGGSIRVDDELHGAISSKDIFRILLFGGSVVKVKLKGKLLIEVLDYGVKSRGTGAYLQRYNFSKSDENKWEIGGKQILPNEIYTIAMSDFLLRGLDISFLTAKHPDVLEVYFPDEDEIPGDIRRAVINYLKSLKN